MSRVTPVDITIAETIKSLRKNAGFTQPRVADHLNIAYQSYQKLERGRVSFRASTLFALSNLYQVPLENILKGAIAPVNPEFTQVIMLLSSMDEGQRKLAVHELVRIKHADSWNRNKD